MLDATVSSPEITLEIKIVASKLQLEHHTALLTNPELLKKSGSLQCKLADKARYCLVWVVLDRGMDCQSIPRGLATQHDTYTYAKTELTSVANKSFEYFTTHTELAERRSQPRCSSHENNRPTDPFSKASPHPSLAMDSHTPKYVAITLRPPSRARECISYFPAR